MQRCCVIDCQSNKQTSDNNITYFKFPFDDDNLLQKWISQIANKDWKPKEEDKICAAHFSTTDIEPTTNNYKKLKDGAVPTIFPSSKIEPGFVIKNEQVCNNESNSQDVKLISFQGPTPVILTPQLVKQLPRMMSGQRYRKILPKVEQSTDVVLNSSQGYQQQVPAPIPVSVPAQSMQNTSNAANPCLIIIPFDNNTPALSNLSPAVSNCPVVPKNEPVVPKNEPVEPSNNVGSDKSTAEITDKSFVLKVEVNRYYTKEQYTSEFPQVNNKVGDESEKEMKSESVDTNDGQVFVDNFALNRRVVFSLDPVTGELKLTKCAIPTETTGQPEEIINNSKIKRKPLNRRQLKNETKSNPPNNTTKRQIKRLPLNRNFRHDSQFTLLDLNNGLKDDKINSINQNINGQKSIITEANLQERYTKAQKNFNVLRRRVRVLRQTRKREIDQVEKLQNQLDHLKSDSQDKSRVSNNHEESYTKKLKSLTENESMLNNEVLIIKLPPNQCPQTSDNVSAHSSPSSINSSVSIIKSNNVHKRTTASGIINSREAAEKTISRELMDIN
ncbi:uncharacterized protein LOC130664216 [Microplitis mediator]|uniref:uncharacterized protein LOC130664216 n=1 Tax=Microplitis mediator TaxID=375433 RepID=UPI00255771B9|nr:uncharacterized protein LOC130664216 [Microplitis mediator]